MLHYLRILDPHILACVRRITVMIVQETHQHGLGVNAAEEHVRIAVQMRSFVQITSL